MSGDSFEYLFLKDPEDLIHKPLLIADMRDQLQTYEGSEKAVEATEQVLDKIEELTKLLEKVVGPQLREVWRVVEYNVSLDIGKEVVLEQLKAFNESQEAPQ